MHSNLMLLLLFPCFNLHRIKVRHRNSSENSSLIFYFEKWLVLCVCVFNVCDVFHIEVTEICML